MRLRRGCRGSTERNDAGGSEKNSTQPYHARRHAGRRGRARGAAQGRDNHSLPAPRGLGLSRSEVRLAVQERPADHSRGQRRGGAAETVAHHAHRRQRQCPFHLVSDGRRQGRRQAGHRPCGAGCVGGVRRAAGRCWPECARYLFYSANSRRADDGRPARDRRSWAGRHTTYQFIRKEKPCRRSTSWYRRRRFTF